MTFSFPKQLKELISVLIVLAIFSLIFTYPALFHLHDRVIGDGVDNYQALGFQYLANVLILSGKSIFSISDYWRYPAGFDFSLGYDSVIFITTGLILYRITNDPVLVYNTSIIIILFISSIFSYLFFEKITKDILLGIIGTVIYSYFFFVLARLGGHPNLLLVGIFPFFLYSLIVFKERSADFFGILIFFFALNLIYLASLQFFVFLVIGFSFLLILLTFFYKKFLIDYLMFFKNTIKKTYILFLFSFLFFILLNVKWLIVATSVARPEVFMTWLSPKPLNFLFPNYYLRDFLLLSIPYFNKDLWWGIESSVFIGYIELLLFVFFLLSGKKFKQKLFIALFIVIFVVLSLGCQPDSHYPYCYLYEQLPFRAIAEPGRFYIIFYLGMTLAVLFFLKNIRLKYKSVVYLVILLLVSVERIPSGIYLSSTKRDEPFLDYVKNADTKAVLDLPLTGHDDGLQKAATSIYSVYYNKPIVDGYVRWTADNKESKKFIGYLSAFKCDNFALLEDLDAYAEIVDLIKVNNIRVIVFHKDYVFEYDSTSDYCYSAMVNSKNLLYFESSGFKKLYEDANKEVFYLK